MKLHIKIYNIKLIFQNIRLLCKSHFVQGFIYTEGLLVHMGNIYAPLYYKFNNKVKNSKTFVNINLIFIGLIYCYLQSNMKRSEI